MTCRQCPSCHLLCLLAHWSRATLCLTVRRGHLVIRLALYPRWSNLLFTVWRETFTPWCILHKRQRRLAGIFRSLRHMLISCRSSRLDVLRGRPGDFFGLTLPSSRYRLRILETELWAIPRASAISTCLCPLFRSASTLWRITSGIGPGIVVRSLCVKFDGKWLSQHSKRGLNTRRLSARKGHQNDSKENALPFIAPNKRPRHVVECFAWLTFTLAILIHYVIDALGQKWLLKGQVYP